MKNSNDYEVPLLNIERSVGSMILIIIISSIISYFAYYLLAQINPWGFLVMVPAAIFSFQSLWMLLNPFAHVFEDRIEIKQSLFSNKLWYYVDIKSISENSKGVIYVKYKDDEVEPMKLRGIKPSHLELLKSEISKRISK